MIAPNSTIDVGALQVGTNANEALCLLNTGTSAISVTGVTVTGTDFSPSAGTVLPLVVQPNAASPLVAGFNFAPTAAGTRTGQISLVDDASGSPQTFTLSGTGYTDFGLNMLVFGTNTQTITAGQTVEYSWFFQALQFPLPPLSTALSASAAAICRRAQAVCFRPLLSFCKLSMSL